MATKKTVTTATENAEAATPDVVTATGDTGKTDTPASTATGTDSSAKSGTADASATQAPAASNSGNDGDQVVTASYEGTFSLETAPVEAGKNIIREAEAPTYTPEEFAKVAYKIFDVPYPQDIVLVALKLAGKKAYTKAEAEAIVKAFANKEV